MAVSSRPLGRTSARQSTACENVPMELILSEDDAGARLQALRPVYVIVCPVADDPTDHYEPILRGPSLNSTDSKTSFDAELMPILPAIWYALHLPKTRFEVLDPALSAISKSVQERRRHQILLAPESLLHDHDMLASIGRFGEPMLILCTDAQLDVARTASKATGFVLPPISTTELAQEALEAHWKAMSNHWSAEWPAWATLDPTPPKWTPDISLQGSALSSRRLRKSLGWTEPSADEPEDSRNSAFDLLQLRAWVEALTTLEEQGVGHEEAESQIEDALADTWRRLRVPLTLSLPGVAPRYRRFGRQLLSEHEVTENGASRASVYGGSAPTPSSASILSENDPPEVLSLMVAHQAAGDDSMGVVSVDPVPDEAFIALANLERYWVDGGRSMKGVQPKKEEALRRRLDQAMESFWTESMVAAVRSASQIDAFTNFPIGLLRMPGDAAPLAALIPIAYRPINPLTRALQIEFDPDRVIDLSGGMSVLVVECISDTDPVGQASRAAWSCATEYLTDASRSVAVKRVSVSNKEQFAAAVARHRPDVLVISAHGFYTPGANVAGLMIGTEPSLGDDLGRMPPMVILSACHSGPRGAGPVSVSDLLLRAGAKAVLSTLVPVEVQHNSTFMLRFLHYMSKAIGGSENHVNVLDLWHRVQTNTVIIDVIHGNPKLTEWGYSKADGESPIAEFMRSRSRGKIRLQHLYTDTEAVLLEIAADRGEETAVRGWLRSPGYVPESMMYTFVGDPSCIRLQAPRLVIPRH